MKSEDFFKYHWKAYEVVEYIYRDTIIQCSILAIDFDCHVMKLIPVKDMGYEEKEFWCSIELIRKIVKNQKLKISYLPKVTL